MRRMTSSFRRLLLTGILGLGLVALGFGAPSEGRAQPTDKVQRTPAPKSGKVEVSVMVVHATDKGEVDPRLEPLKRQLEIMRFEGFKLLSHDRDKLSDGQATTVSVVGGSKVRVKLIDRTNAQARVRIELYRDNDKRLDTTVRINRNRTFLVGGPKHQEGVLVFPITVTY
ncbi:MAG: hypothetical protein AAF211_28865 [Myxococcota bacterium]